MKSILQVYDILREYLHYIFILLYLSLFFVSEKLYCHLKLQPPLHKISHQQRSTLPLSSNDDISLERIELKLFICKLVTNKKLEQLKIYVFVSCLLPFHFLKEIN